MDITLVRVVETCAACPSQWNAWDAQGCYYYLRYRHGRGTVHRFASPDITAWAGYPHGAVRRFAHGDVLDGYIELGEFCRRAGLKITEDADIT